MMQPTVRILCVDDEPHNLSLMEAILAPHGYELVLVTSGREALDKIATEQIDICLLDVMMPEMDGFEVCRRIKADEQHRNIPVVMITLYNDRENRIRGIESGAEDLISKPFDSAEVLARIKMLLHVKSLNDRLSELNLQQQAILDNIPNVTWLRNCEGTYLAVNEPFSSMFGLTPQDLVGKCDRDIYPPELAMKYEKDFQEVVKSGIRTYFEESTVDRHGNVRHMEKIKTPIFNDSGAVIGVIGIAHDVTSRKEIEVKLRHDSTHDRLTGLYNRAFFDEELERFAHGRRFPLSIVVADVNDLKAVNDSRGHDAGDDLIRTVAGILLHAFRSEDVVARIGGDEFAILLPATEEAVARDAIARLRHTPEIVAGRMGIAFGTACAECPDQLETALKLADERMYLDKAAQKDP